MRATRLLFLIAAFISVVPTADATLSLADFDVVAFSAHNGGIAIETADGIRATLEPILDGAVNFMLRDASLLLFVTDGPNNHGRVKFGFVDDAVWTPMDGDLAELGNLSVNALGDRVYVEVVASGNVDLFSASSFQRVHDVMVIALLTPDLAARVVCAVRCVGEILSVTERPLRVAAPPDGLCAGARRVLPLSFRRKHHSIAMEHRCAALPTHTFDGMPEIDLAL